MRGQNQRKRYTDAPKKKKKRKKKKSFCDRKKGRGERIEGKGREKSLRRRNTWNAKFTPETRKGHRRRRKKPGESGKFCAKPARNQRGYLREK